MRPHISDIHQYRNINLLSIGYVFPDFPRADQLYSGNLGYSAVRILTLLSLLIPAFSLQSTPRLLTVTLRRAFNAPLPITICDSSASVSCFSPGNFRRRTSRPVSYYALFQCVAASEPTSWLSSKSHILYQLYLHKSAMRLALKLFRGEPAISGFDWNFSPTHTSCPPFSTDVASDLHCLLRQLHPGHG